MAQPPPEATGVHLSVKLTLAGDHRVGKTSLLRRFVSNTFDERYVTTLGAKVDSKTFIVADPRAPASLIEVGAQIWDVMGNPGLRELLKDAFFNNTKGMLLVCDATRPETVESLPKWYTAASFVAGEIPVVVLLNKVDLTDESRVSPQDMDRSCSARGWTWLPTSAKLGQNVEKAFEKVTEFYLASLRRSDPTKET